MGETWKVCGWGARWRWTPPFIVVVENFSGRFSSKKDGVAVEGWILNDICLSEISGAKQIQQPFLLKRIFLLVNEILNPLPLFNFFVIRCSRSKISVRRISYKHVVTS